MFLVKNHVLTKNSKVLESLKSLYYTSKMHYFDSEIIFGLKCNSKAPISLGCDEFAMGLRIDSPNRRELSRNVRMVSQSPRMHRELVANGSPKF